MAQERIKRILACIESGEHDDGWRRFLSAYSDLLYSIVSQFETEETRAQDCYDHVCAGLSDDGFRRLSRFNPEGPATFKTWLTAVAANLCRDWRRIQFGRRRIPEAVLRLPEFDQLVFDLVYRQALTQAECLSILDAGNPGFKRQDLHDSLARLHVGLSARSRWLLSMRDRTSQDIDPDQLESGAAGPETLYQSDAELERLDRALRRLDPKQRLLLQLRYQQDLTLKEVAALVGLADPFAAKRAIDKSLIALKKAMRF